MNSCHFWRSEKLGRVLYILPLTFLEIKWWSFINETDLYYCLFVEAQTSYEVKDIFLFWTCSLFPRVNLIYFWKLLSYLTYISCWVVINKNWKVVQQEKDLLLHREREKDRKWICWLKCQCLWRKEKENKISTMYNEMDGNWKICMKNA